MPVPRCRENAADGTETAELLGSLLGEKVLHLAYISFQGIDSQCCTGRERRKETVFLTYDGQQFVRSSAGSDAYFEIGIGGQCQRVAIARAIVGNPEIILADEPTGNLDSKMGAEVMELLHKLNKEDGRTIVMVTHNEEQAKQTSRTIRFFDGRQVQ